MEGHNASVYREISTAEDFKAVKKPLFSHLLKFTELQDEFPKFLYQEGLLGDFSGTCATCGVGTVKFICDGKNPQTGQPTFMWRCTNRSCRKKLSARHGSFFEGSRLSKRIIILLIYCFAARIPQHVVRNNLIDISPHTMVDWYKFCRSVCSKILLADNKKIGGPGHVVEIDESKFGKRKYNRGRKVDGCWVFGGIDRQTRETFFRVVPDVSAESLLPVLLENVLPETTIISDSWKAYNNVRDHYFRHNVVDHNVNFVSPNDPTVHTNTIESQWRVLKRSALPRHGTQKDLYDSYFSAHCVQKRYLEHAPCPFWAFLELIKRVYPLKSRPTPPVTESLSQPKTARPGPATFKSTTVRPGPATSKSTTTVRPGPATSASTTVRPGPATFKSTFKIQRLNPDESDLSDFE
ncbi:uncharacterized protein [Macrobrachium rosenbergii]|uniref:uncharacterized protein n=1 Tax=Macrobrachium rosenbergii TaxID=79674 RepID=UPI0034D3BBA8